ncbi:serine-rich adhesin for platelets-like isoform X3 [Watersipora subatra]|uniref:serine-rich adhesin for platelets-like isoform X3 n=1 Tax=Watersipora subatra TaxID=2589382 RepID=UPI00355B35D2
MASKLFNKLGVGRKHKSVDLEPAVITEQTVPQEIEACVEYSLPPDCEENDVYHEPADSLNTISSSTSSTQSHTTSTRETLDSDTLSMSASSTHNDTPTADLTKSSKERNEVETEPNLKASEPTGLADPSQPDETDLEAPAEQLCISDTHPIDNTERSEADPSFAVYMNDSQIKAAKAGTSKSVITPKLNPETDPRNMDYVAAGNEYDSPWDLQTELIQVAKQMHSPSPLVTNSNSSLVSQRSPTSDSTLVASPTSAAELTLGHKVDYSSMRSSHKVKQPHVHRQTSRKAAPPASVANVVLVEGEWREAKPSTLLPSPSSPELTSPKQILSKPVSRTGSNAATNCVYAQGSGEIKVQQRFSEEKPKFPCAQPRGSISMSPPPSDDRKIYENIPQAKKALTNENADADGLYDDPWDVERVQQDIFDQLERQKQKTITSDVKHKRQSEELTSDRSYQGDIFAVPEMLKRPVDLPSEGGSFRSMSETTSRRLLSSSSSSSDKMDKHSVRALPATPIKGTAPPQLPHSSPGQLHTNNPVLVVQKNIYPSFNTPERKGSTSSTRHGSMRKTRAKHAQGIPTEGLECQHRIGLTVNKNLPITQQLWYHGAIQRFQAEELLRTKPDGSFLIRESSNSPRDKTLSLKNHSTFRHCPERNLSGFIHIMIVHQPDGTVILGQFSHPFKNIMEMVEYYSRHKVNIKGAEHTYLEIPVLRER